MRILLGVLLLIGCGPSASPEPVDEVDTGSEQPRTDDATSSDSRAPSAPVAPWMLPAWDGDDPSSIECAPGGVLPAGIYQPHRVGERDVGAQLECPPARAAVMQSFRSAQRATQALQDLRDVELAPGYPWVPARAGTILVILGRFARVDDASLWLAQHRDQIGSGWRAQAWYPSEGPDRIVHVTGETPAFSTRDADQIASAGSPEAYALALDEARPVCVLPAGTIHVRDVREESRDRRAPEAEVEPVEPAGFEEVRCGSTRAWVARVSTSVEAVAYTHRDGSAWVRQLVGWSCGEPVVSTWRLTDAGLVEGRTQSSRACGLR